MVVGDLVVADWLKTKELTPSLWDVLGCTVIVSLVPHLVYVYSFFGLLCCLPGSNKSTHHLNELIPLQIVLTEAESNCFILLLSKHHAEKSNFVRGSIQRDGAEETEFNASSSLQGFLNFT